MRRLLLAAFILTLPGLALAETLDVKLSGPDGGAAMKGLADHLLSTPNVTAVSADIGSKSVKITATADIDDCHIGPLMQSASFKVLHVLRTPEVKQPEKCPHY